MPSRKLKYYLVSTYHYGPDVFRAKTITEVKKYLMKEMGEDFERYDIQIEKIKVRDI